MAGVSTETRDLEELRDNLRNWFVECEDDPTVTISEFEQNQSSGFSNQTIFFRLQRPRRAPVPLVLRMPPAGEGLFPTYDLEMQAKVQSMLSVHGLPAADPVRFEPSDRWLGTPFMVMPWIEGQSPNDVAYVFKGWLHDASPGVQRSCVEHFVDLLGLLHTLDVGPYRDVLARPGGSGLEAELKWWRDYLLWAGDGDPPREMLDAYDWASETCPGSPFPDSVLWNDARLSNVVFAPDGRIAGALDWEQASIGPAEMDIGYWFSTRRQTCEVLGVTSDPELPGFPSRSELVSMLQKGLGRSLHELEWHETFAMVRMGTCIVGTQRVLRRSGQHEHFIMHAPLLPDWALARMS